MYTVNGQVLDEFMGIIPYANIKDLASGNAVQADENGKFRINVAGPTSQLRISHAGYDYDTVDAGYFEDISYFQLWTSSLDEVVLDNDHKESDNTIWWVLGGIAAVAMVAVASSNNNKLPRKINV